MTLFPLIRDFQKIFSKLKLTLICFSIFWRFWPNNDNKCNRLISLAGSPNSDTQHNSITACRKDYSAQKDDYCNILKFIRIHVVAFFSSQNFIFLMYLLQWLCFLLSNKFNLLFCVAHLLTLSPPLALPFCSQPFHNLKLLLPLLH